MPAWRLTLFTLLLSACAPAIPATAPPQLEHTPGAFVVVTDRRFDAGLFRLDYPTSWRIVKTSIAAADRLQVVFVAPDTSTITLTQVDSADDEQTVSLDNGIILQVRIQPADNRAASFAPIAQKLIASIRSP